LSAEVRTLKRRPFAHREHRRSLSREYLRGGLIDSSGSQEISIGS
jgi:hypothetical protein